MTVLQRHSHTALTTMHAPTYPCTHPPTTTTHTHTHTHTHTQQQQQQQSRGSEAEREAANNRIAGHAHYLTIWVRSRRRQCMSSRLLWNSSRLVSLITCMVYVGCERNRQRERRAHARERDSRAEYHTPHDTSAHRTCPL